MLQEQRSEPHHLSTEVSHTQLDLALAQFADQDRTHCSSECISPWFIQGRHRKWYPHCSSHLWPQADLQGWRGETWFTTEAVGRAFPSKTAAVVNNHTQLLLLWGFPFFLPFPSLPIRLFASGKWLCRYSQVPFQKLRLLKANNEHDLGKTKLSVSLASACRSHGNTPS